MELRSCISALTLCLVSLLSAKIAPADTVIDHGTYFDTTRLYSGSHIYVTGGHYLQDYKASPDGVFRGTINYDAESPFAQGGIGTKFARFTFNVGFYQYLTGTVTDKFQALVSNDNSTFTPVPLTPTVAGANGTTRIYNLDTGPISARFVRFVVLVDSPVAPATSPNSWTLPIYQITAVTQAPASAVEDNGQTANFGSVYSGVTPDPTGLIGSTGGYVIYDATTAPFKGTPNSSFTNLVFSCSMSSTIKDVQKLDFKDIYKVDVSSDQVTWQPLAVLFTAGGRNSSNNDLAGASTGPLSKRYVRVSIGASATVTNLTLSTRAGISLWDPCIDYTHGRAYYYIYTDKVIPSLANRGFHQTDSTNQNLTGSIVYDAESVGGPGAKFTGINLLDTLWLNAISQYGFGYNDKFKAYVSDNNYTFTEVPLAFGTMLQNTSGYLPNTAGATIPIHSQFVKITNTTLDQGASGGISSWAVANNSVLLTIGAVLTGNITLEGVTDLSAISPGATVGNITFDFRNPGSTMALFSRTSPLAITGGAASGVYILNDVPYGTYDIAIKGIRSLRVVLQSVTVGPVTTMPDVTLPTGDTNGDNTVDIADFGVLVNAYGTAYDPNDPGSGYDTLPDFNLDGFVDIADFGILVNEYGSSGDM